MVYYKYKLCCDKRNIFALKKRTIRQWSTWILKVVLLYVLFILIHLQSNLYIYTIGIKLSILYFYWPKSRDFMAWLKRFLYKSTYRNGIPKFIHRLKRPCFLGLLSPCKMPNFDDVDKQWIKEGSVFQYLKTNAPSKLWQLNLGLDARVFGGLRTTQAQTSLRIRAVWSAPLLFAFWKVLHVNLLQGKFQFSS